MVHISDVALAASFIAGLLGLFLLALAARVYARTKNPQMVFLIAAFGVFALKSFVVAYAIHHPEFLHHEELELVDSLGDMATVLLIAVPLFLRRDPR